MNSLLLNASKAWQILRNKNWATTLMSNEKAEKIVTDLMSDKELYKKMSAKEGEVWGKIFTDENRIKAIAEDQKAAAELRIGRYKFGLPTALKQHGLTPKNGLSLACGSGRAERQLITAGVCETFHAIDIAEGALEEARTIAANENLAITYQQADLNELSLTPNSYDLVVTQNCLHHVLRLEDLAEQIHGSLRPDGLLWIHDYIGETQFQYTDERLEIVNEILAILPERFRENIVNRRNLDKIIRRKPGTLVSPFEAIRSAEIMPVFLQHFDVVQKHESDSIMDLVCPHGTRSNFVQSEEGKVIFELLLMMDKLLIEKDVLEPRGGIYLLKAK